MGVPTPPSNSSGMNSGATPASNGSAGGGLYALGHYRILRSLGAGGMSEVYLAYDAKLRCQVAIKLLADHLVGNPSFVNRFLQEGRLSKELSHPHLVKAHEFGRDPASGKYYIAMELVDGLTAQEVLERDGRLSVAAATSLVVDVARALEYLHHHKFVHRDIKPGNILIGPDGSAKLIDLGVAKQLDNANVLTTLDHSVGTPYYMPWEQSVNSGLVDGRSDIFALGATYYHLLTGHVPFPGDDEAAISTRKTKGDYTPARQHNRQLPASIETVLERMLARDPRKRFANCRDVVEILSAAGLSDSSVTDYVLPDTVTQPLAPTRADLQAQSDVDTPLESGSEQLLWRVKFQRPEDGCWRKALGRTAEVIRLYKEGVLPELVFAAREPSKVYRKLQAYPEFRQLCQREVIEAADRPNPLRRPRSLPPRPPWRLYLSSLIYTGGVTLLLCATVAIIMRLISCLN
jgi:eukaryotic-like serine/threonine-protein kinase